MPFFRFVFFLFRSPELVMGQNTNTTLQQQQPPQQSSSTTSASATTKSKIRSPNCSPKGKTIYIRYMYKYLLYIIKFNYLYV